MAMRLYPENIRRFVEEVSIHPSGKPTGWKDQGITEKATPRVQGGSVSRTPLNACREERKGVKVCSTAAEKAARLSRIQTDALPNVHYSKF
jgi:hypothetical protein